jgi:hypothetical protein
MDLVELTDDELIEHLTTWAGRVAAGEAELLRLIGELDARSAWAVHGVTSCAHWLSWQLGYSATTARERVRVARALRELPLTATALAEGRLSYCRVRAVTRVASATNEHVWVDLARHSTGAQLDSAVRGVARATAAEQDPGSGPDKPAVTKRWDDDGDLVLTLRIPAHQAPGVLAALEQHQAAEQTDRDARLATLASDVLPGASAEAFTPYEYVEPDHPLMGSLGVLRQRTPAELKAVAEWEAERDRRRALRNASREQHERLLAEAAARHVPTGKATLADAFVRALLHPAEGPPVKLQLLVDPASGWARTRHDELLPPATLAGVLRTLPGRHRVPTARPLHPADLRRHDLGRRTRVVTPALRALLGQVDGERCRFPGCDHTRFLHAHHVIFWRNGGSTDLSNLVLLCTRHHRYLHQNGTQLTLRDDRTLDVRTADGTPLLHHLTPPSASAEALPHIAPEAITSKWGGESMDLGYVVSVLMQHAA